MNSHWNAASIVFTIIIIYFLFKLFSSFSGKKQTDERKNVHNTFSAEEIQKVQQDFEVFFEKGRKIRYPATPDGNTMFIYYKMKTWFWILHARLRHSEEQQRKITLDWLEYIRLVDSISTDTYLCLEKSDGKEKDTAWELVHIDRVRRNVIEDEIAQAIGNDAFSYLEYVRSVDRHRFDSTGQKDIAPVGFYYDYFGEEGNGRDELIKRS